MDRAPAAAGMDMPIMHDSDRYDLVKDIGSGNFGIARLMRDKQTKELVAVKYIERGDKRILNVQYCIPENIEISPECRHLISRIFVADPAMNKWSLLKEEATIPSYKFTIVLRLIYAVSLSDFEECNTFVLALKKRISMPEIRNHEWFLKNLPADLMDEKMISDQFEEPEQPMQSIDVIMQIISEATVPPPGLYDMEMDDYLDDLDSDPDSLDIDSSGEIIYAL
uniref:Protein kinase domain-containing protein n=1 Tax=Daucus carota subsp. sativus TaxID=79200 RepID=A0A164UAJ7_DAUCS